MPARTRERRTADLFHAERGRGRWFTYPHGSAALPVVLGRRQWRHTHPARQDLEHVRLLLAKSIGQVRDVLDGDDGVRLAQDGCGKDDWAWSS